MFVGRKKELEALDSFYNSNKKTLKIWSFQNYKKEYTFDISGKQIKSR